MSPFELDLGWTPRQPLDSLSGYSEDTIQTVTDFKSLLEESFDSTRFAQRLAQAR